MRAFWRFSGGLLVGMAVAPALKPAVRGVFKNVIKVGLVAGRQIHAELSELVEAAKEDLEDVAAEVAADSDAAKK